MHKNIVRQELQLYDNTGGFLRAGIGGGVLLKLLLVLAGLGGVVEMEDTLQPLCRGGPDATILLAAVAASVA